MDKKMSFREVIKIIKSEPKIQGLPRKTKSLLNTYLKAGFSVDFPIITFKENNWFIATTPIIDVSAQGKTEEESIKNLEAMIEDYMSDPDTSKPKIDTIVNMRLGVKIIPVEFPLDYLERTDHHSRKNTPVTAR